MTQTNITLTIRDIKNSTVNDFEAGIVFFLCRYAKTIYIVAYFIGADNFSCTVLMMPH